MGGGLIQVETMGFGTDPVTSCIGDFCAGGIIKSSGGTHSTAVAAGVAEQVVVYTGTNSAGGSTNFLHTATGITSIGAGAYTGLLESTGLTDTTLSFITDVAGVGAGYNIGMDNTATSFCIARPGTAFGDAQGDLMFRTDTQCYFGSTGDIDFQINSIQTGGGGDATLTVKAFRKQRSYCTCYVSIGGIARFESEN